MAKTPSNMLPLGTALPNFSCPSVNHMGVVDAALLQLGQPVMIAFICNHCPFVIHIMDPFVALLNQYQGKGVACIAISSNDIRTHPADAPERMAELAVENDFKFPYCYDESQAVARAFDAACTPDFYLFGQDHQLVYRGQFDDSRPSNQIAVTGIDLQRAMDQALAGEAVTTQQRPSLGCNIKWKEHEK